MRRMNELKKEKEDLMKQVDVEEDHITNTLLKKLGTWLSPIPLMASYKRRRRRWSRNWSTSRSAW